MIFLRLVSLGLLAALAIAGSATAQGLAVVQSGEHLAFSRLVFPASGRIEWSVSAPDQGTSTIKFTDSSLRFDLSRVFDKIPRDRLRAISSDGPELTLSLDCNCPLEITQIGSGHVVIDIGDETGLDSIPASRPDPPATADLPLRLPPVETLAIGFRAPLPVPAELARVGPLRTAVGLATNEEPSLPQISIREHARATLLPSTDDARGSTTTLRPACDLETIAAEILLHDPVEALENLGTRRAAIVDGADLVSPESLRLLARTYLEMGWGTEAAQILSPMEVRDKAELLQLASAIDGDPNLTNDPLPASPACGPATTSLLLISGQFSGSWGSVDEEALIRFVDRLDSKRRADLEPRLRDGLARLGHENVLLRLAALPVPVLPYDPPSDDALAAGTDLNAIRSTMATLSEGIETGTGVSTIHFQNALALRPSIPDGPLRVEFDETLSRSLMLSGRFSETLDVVRDRPDLAGALLSMALQELPPEQVVEVAIRLRPYLRSDAADILPVADLLRGFGLTSTAREFEAIRTGEGISARPTLWRKPVDDQENASLSDTDKAWLSRDFELLSEAGDPATPSPRQQLATAVERRNANDLPADDFAAAERILTDSRNLSDVVGRLLGPEE